MSVMAGLSSLITSGSIVHNTNNNDTEKDDTVSFLPFWLDQFDSHDLQ